MLCGGTPLSKKVLVTTIVFVLVVNAEFIGSIQGFSLHLMSGKLVFQLFLNAL